MLLGPLGLKLLLLVQAAQSSVTGVIRDSESGKPLPDALVELGDLHRSAVSDSLGRYRFPDVPPGPQHLSVRRIGYAPRTMHALVPGDGRLQIDLSLDPVPLHLPVLVARSRVPIRGSEAAEPPHQVDRTVSLAELRTDPLLSEPDGLLGLTGGEVSADLETPSGIHVHGGASDQVRYLLDGIPVLSPYHSAGTFTAWNPDALERLDLASAVPAAGFADALSGTISATTLTPGPSVRVQGGVSTGQARLAMDGPVGRSGAGYLVSYRTGFPALFAPHDPTYLTGSTGDLIVKAETPAAGGRLRLLVYDGGNELGASTGGASAPVGLGRNGFEWGSRSVGGQWGRLLSPSTLLRVQGWTATNATEAGWVVDVPSRLTARRQDAGVLATVEQSGRRSRTVSGFKLERSTTAYRVDVADGSDQPFRLGSEDWLPTLFLQHDRLLGSRTSSTVALSGTAAQGRPHLSLHTQLRWQASRPLGFSLGYSRAHQFAQSLRNPESVVGNVFPPDLYIGAGAPGVPVAENQRLVLGAEYRPATGVRLSAQGYLSSSEGLLLVAPTTSDPFATSGFVIGSGTAPGFSLDAAVSGTRYGLLARYGWQRVRLEYGDTSYTPLPGISHLLELGAILFPSATASVRFGLTAGMGRSGTSIAGAFEWEACNILDRGCEFSGSPRTSGGLGATELPAYLRLDLGVRKHWHLHFGQRDVVLGLFGSVSNLLGRTNVLTMTTDPRTGRTSVVEMRPLAPLVAGLDWRF